jgi:3-methyl-2-oxobutanoate hydroxymethyltransferase
VFSNRLFRLTGNHAVQLQAHEGGKVMAKKKKTILDLQEMKRQGITFSSTVVYDALWASFVDKTGIDVILCGDSMGMIMYGYDSTLPVTMEQMIDRCKAVRCGAPNTFLMGDMPFGSYQENVAAAVHNAIRLIKETGVDAVKLEGGRSVVPQIKAMTDAGIVVIAHLGLTPQSAGVLGGFKTQSRTVDSARELIKDCIAVQEAGAKAILVESVPAEVMKFLVDNVSVPVFGAGVPCDGQGLNFADMLGLFQQFTPKFVKKYLDLGDQIVEAMQTFDDEVKSRAYPAEEHAYHIKDGIEAFEEMFTEFESSFFRKG